MTENEALGYLKNSKRQKSMLEILPGSDIGNTIIKALEELKQYRTIGTPEELQDMKNNYFEALSDWRQYRKIGTLEECRTAVEKQKAKKPRPIDYKKYIGIVKNAEYLRGAYWCLNCNQAIKSGTFCKNCGQKLDWSDEE